MSKLYGVFERTTASSYMGSSTDVYYLKGLFKSKEQAKAMANRPFASKGYVHNAEVFTIETDLFDEKGE